MPGREDERLAFVAHDLRTPLNAVCLLVVKQIVEVHGGSVSADNAQESGATLRFSIPKPEQ
jgi:signal transduction histidine kinase